jgi:hypothetical protein
MQKVVGSNPISRSARKPRLGGVFSCRRGASDSTNGPGSTPGSTGRVVTVRLAPANGVDRAVTRTPRAGRRHLHPAVGRAQATASAADPTGSDANHTDRPDRPPWRIVHVDVFNDPISGWPAKWLLRNTATGCHVKVRLRSLSDGREMPWWRGKWSAQPEPVQYLTVTRPDGNETIQPFWDPEQREEWNDLNERLDTNEAELGNPGRVDHIMDRGQGQASARPCRRRLPGLEPSGRGTRGAVRLAVPIRRDQGQASGDRRALANALARWPEVLVRRFWGFGGAQDPGRSAACFWSLLVAAGPPGIPMASRTGAPHEHRSPNSRERKLVEHRHRQRGASDGAV